MSETTPNIKDRVAANNPPKSSRSRKSTVHDDLGGQSRADKKKAIAQKTDAIVQKAVADANALVDELYSETFLNVIDQKFGELQALDFTQIQSKAKSRAAMKTANLIAPKQQLAIAGSTGSETSDDFIPAESWIAWEDDL